MEPDNGPIIVVTTYNLLATAFLATSAKVVTKWTVINRFQIDDLYIILALLCAVGYAVALQFQMQGGLGRSIVTMDTSDVVEFGKAEYAQEILYVSSLGFAKWTVLEYMLTLAAHQSHKLISKIVICINILKTVAAIFALAFQCTLPMPWDLLGGKCFDRIAFWTAFGCLDILIDLATIALPVFLLSQLQMMSKYRWKAIVAFSLRIFVIPIAITRLVILNMNRHSDDRPRTDYAISIITSVHITVSILASCIPFLKKIFQNLSLGMYGAEMTPSKYANPKEGRVVKPNQEQEHPLKSGLTISSAAVSRKDSEAGTGSSAGKEAKHSNPRGESESRATQPQPEQVSRDGSIERLIHKKASDSGTSEVVAHNVGESQELEPKIETA